jgi:hypothetical protein
MRLYGTLIMIYGIRVPPEAFFAILNLDDMSMRCILIPMDLFLFAANDLELFLALHFQWKVPTAVIPARCTGKNLSRTRSLSLLNLRPVRCTNRVY